MTEIIAEAGVNHCGSVTTAMRMIDAAVAAGVGVVKFQTFDVKRLLRENDPDWSKLSQLMLTRPEFVRLARHCENIKIEFLSTPGDPDSLKFLIEECGVRRIKIGSDDLTNGALMCRAAQSNLPVIVSTGMATIPEIAISLPNHNYGNFTLLHCVSEYPCPPERVNLKAMDELRVFTLPVGYSDHTNGLEACIAAAARGAVIVEKHFRLLATNNCPDEAVSTTELGLKILAQKISLVEKTLGDGKKRPTQHEYVIRNVLRKGPDGLRGAA